jgi:hypothetical protein
VDHAAKQWLKALADARRAQNTFFMEGQPWRPRDNSLIVCFYLKEVRGKRENPN